MIHDSYQQAYLDHELEIPSITRIVSNSGSGKSTTIATKIANILNSGSPEESTIAITFTNKAAFDLKQKIKRQSGKSLKYCSTIHGLSITLLKDNEVSPIVMNEWQSLLLVRKIMETHGLSTGTKKLDTTLARDLLQKFNTMRVIQYDLNPFEFPLLEHFTDITINLNQFVEIYVEYDTHKKSKNLWDFQDLISPRSEKLVKKLPDTKYVYIDECLDYNTPVNIKVNGGRAKTVPIGEVETLLTDGNLIEIDSPDGWVEVTKFIPKGIKPTIRIELEDGRELVCTPDHLIETHNRGWVEAQHLTEDDDIITKE